MEAIDYWGPCRALSSMLWYSRSLQCVMQRGWGSCSKLFWGIMQITLASKLHLVLVGSPLLNVLSLSEVAKGPQNS